MKRLSQKSLAWSFIVLFVAVCGLFAEENGKSEGGAAIFKSKCVLCHGADGTSSTPLGKQLQAANLHSKDVQKLSDAELQKIVHDGRGSMPAFADQLSDQEIAQVIKYVRHIAKASAKGSSHKH